MTTVIARQVLHDVLEQRSVVVKTIYDALEGLDLPPAQAAPEPNRIQRRILAMELIAGAAAQVVEAQDAWNKACEADTLVVDEFSALQGAIDALRPLLADLST